MENGRENMIGGKRLKKGEGEGRDKPEARTEKRKRRISSEE